MILSAINQWIEQTKTTRYYHNLKQPNRIKTNHWNQLLITKFPHTDSPLFSNSPNHSLITWNTDIERFWTLNNTNTNLIALVESTPQRRARRHGEREAETGFLQWIRLCQWSGSPLPPPPPRCNVVGEPEARDEKEFDNSGHPSAGVYAEAGPRRPLDISASHPRPKSNCNIQVTSCWWPGIDLRV